MNNQFHRNLNRMALFAALALVGVIFFHAQFLKLAVANIWLNGVILGVTIFGIGLCFVDIFKLIPEYRWMKKYFNGDKRATLPPRLFRPVAVVLQNTTGTRISTGTLGNFLDIIMGRFEDQRESVRYITNTLIFLGLLGTFWGLVNTVGGFAELVTSLNFNDENVMTTLQSGLAAPMAGMSIAFTSSLFGLAGSLIVGFLGLQVQMAQNSLFRELEENLSENTQTTEVVETDGVKDLARAIEKLEKTVAKLK